MSTTELSTTSRDQLQATIIDQAVPAGAVSILDRIAMRTGLALILWSRQHAAGRIDREPVDCAAIARDRRTAHIDRVQRPVTF